MDQTTERENATQTVQEWRISGDPGQGYPFYVFVFRSDDPRWPGEQTEQAARAQHAAMAKGDTWQDGPHLQHRTVTYGPWSEFVVGAAVERQDV